MELLAAGSGVSEAIEAVSGSSLAFAVRLPIAGVLVVGAATKLRKPAAAAEAMVQFGLLRRRTTVVGLALGGVEAVVAVTLLLGARSALPGLAAAALFTAFAFLIARALRQGRTFSCGCLSSREDPIGAHTLTRTLGLLVLAVIAAAAPLNGALTSRDLLQAAVVAGAAAGLWALASSYLHVAPTWRKFLDTQMDWQLAAELNSGVLGERVG